MKSNQNAYGNSGEKEGTSDIDLGKTEGLVNRLKRKPASSTGEPELLLAIVAYNSPKYIE